MTCNATHDPKLRSWLSSANAPDCGFPIQNLPLAMARPQQSSEPFSAMVAIGDQALNLAALAQLNIVQGSAAQALGLCCDNSLAPLMAAGTEIWSELRRTLSQLLSNNAEQQRLEPCLLPQTALEFKVPVSIGDYTDFYTSIDHARNIGALFRPDEPLLPNYRWVPIGYHGRSSSIVISGENVPRPLGQKLAAGASSPTFGACERLDYELELGWYVGTGNGLGQPVPIEQADEHIFGLCLLNDWSARDIQAWEYQPLGPFLGKNFATSISPWIVTTEALAPFRKPWQRPPNDPPPLPYLSSNADVRDGAFDITLEVLLQTQSMRDTGKSPERIARSNYASAYWTVRQLVTHHASNGCNLQPGDLLGTGTLSGPEPGSEGALIERTAGGRRPLVLANGEQRRFLEDGDQVTLRGYCATAGAVSISLGEVVGIVLPSSVPANDIG